MMPVPLPLRVLIGLLCAGVGLSALALAIAALTVGPKPVWVLFGFELVIAITMPMGVLFAMGKYQDGQGLALACFAGTIAVGSLLGWMGADQQLLVGPSGQKSVKLLPLLLGREAAAGFLGLSGAWLVLRRNSKSWSYFFKSALLGGPLLVVLALFAFKRSAVSGVLDALPGWLSTLLLALLGVGSIVLISASVHCLVRAFELGRVEEKA